MGAVGRVTIGVKESEALMKYTYEDLAGMIDHSLLQPTMTDRDLREGCDVAMTYRVASVCVKPYAVREAAERLRGTGVRVGTVIGFPHGGSATEVKRYETEIACRDGATEIDMVVNVGKALAGDFDYVEGEVRAVVKEAHEHGAIVKVIFENDFLPSDEIKIRMCQASERAGAEFVKTSTGYGFVKGSDGKYSAQGATEHDLALMRAHTSAKVQVKAAGGVRDLDALVKVRDLGATRCGATATVAMLDEYRRREAAETRERAEKPSSGTLGGGGY
jgi:deoxyribose-phosphate aldolase